MKRTRQVLIGVLFLVIICLIMIGLYRLNQQKTLIGKYSAVSGNREELDRHYLELKADGTFFHSMVDYKGKEHANRGKWQVVKRSHGRMIEFRGFMDFTWQRALRETKIPTLVSLHDSKVLMNVPVYRGILSGTKLYFSEDLVFSYKAPLEEGVCSRDGVIQSSNSVQDNDGNTKKLK